MTLSQSQFIDSCTRLAYAWSNPISTLHLAVTTVSQLNNVNRGKLIANYLIGLSVYQRVTVQLD